jgi:hypothetical protein
MFVPFSPKIMRMSTWNSGLWNRRLRHMQNVHFASDIKTMPFLLRSSSISHGLFHNTKILNHKLMVFWPFPEIYLGPTDDLRVFLERIGNTSIHVLRNSTAASTRSKTTCCSEKKLFRGSYHDRLQCCSGIQRVAT